MDDTLPASLSPEVHRVLREELGFDGVVLTDDLAMGAIDQYTNDGSAAVLAILAGNDMVVTTDYHRQIPLVVAAVETGEIPMEIIDAALGRVIGWKYDLGLIDDGDIVTPEGLT
jgi:beta-N-acetylhexosaminidase